MTWVMEVSDRGSFKLCQFYKDDEVLGSLCLREDEDITLWKNMISIINNSSMTRKFTTPK